MEVGIIIYVKIHIWILKKVVLEYLNGGIALIPLAEKYGIKSEANIRV